MKNCLQSVVLVYSPIERLPSSLDSWTKHVNLCIDTHFSEPSGMFALIFDATADESPLPAEPARVALLGSMLRTEATALSIWEDMLEKDRNRMEFLMIE